ncbi:MAG TPA: DNA ligase D [Polyangiales bacterium]|nr:DNA ligase D [Polyangiales bacterium]
MPVPRSSPPAYRAQLATLVAAAPSGAGWLHELKHDGYRLGCTKQGARVKLESRRGNDWTARFPELAAAIAELPARTLLIDGEITALLPDGRTSFQALQNAFSGRPRPKLAFYAFDLLYLEARDVARLPLEERKQLLAELLSRAGAGTVIRYSDHVIGEGARVFERACKLGAEGIVSKRRTEPYRPGRNALWLKVKCLQRQELVVGGFTDPEGSREGVGSMLVGYYDDAGALVFAGKVGTGKGFGQKFWRTLRGRLERLEQKTCPFTPRPTGWLGKHAHWLRPELVSEVEFSEWTAGGHIRHPSLKGFREDKPAHDVLRERAQPSVTLTSPERIMYPALKFTKADLAQFYADIAPWMLPHVRGRPLTLVRCEHGASKADALRSECSFLRHTSGWHRFVPDFVRRERIVEREKIGEYLVIESAAALLAIINGDILELHTWNSTVDHVEQPDRLVFDLDPAPDVAWRRVIDAALLLRERLAARALESWVKTTGGKGLHVCVPLSPVHDWQSCFEFSRGVASELVKKQPRKFTTAFGKAARSGKILIDYKRNHRAAVAIAAFSTRARANGSVSVPIGWEELEAEPGPDRFTVRNLREYLRARKRDPWREYWKCSQTLSSD